MTTFEGDIVENERRTEYAMEISDDNEMFQNCSVSINNLDKHIDSTISRMYEYEPGSLHKQCN